MARTFDPETVNLAQLAEVLRNKVGVSVEGPVVGRTRLRDALVDHMRCSQLEAEELVDTMVGRGFLVRRDRDGLEEWVVVQPRGDSP